jgi:YVTN family beta-propeller protein
MNHHLRLLALAAVLTFSIIQLRAVPPTPANAAGWLLVANKGDRALGIIDPVSGRQVATIPENGVTGHEVVASLDGARAFVPIYGDSGVGSPGTDGSLLRVINLANREIVGTIDFGKGVRPHCAVMGPKDGLLYVTTELNNSVSVIDPQALKVIGSIDTGQPEAHMLAISRDGRRGYTANVASGTISVLDLEARKLLTVIPVSGKVQRIALSADDRWVFTSDQTEPRLAVVDTSSNKVKTWIAMPGKGYGTASTPDGHWLVVALSGLNKVGIVDLTSMKFDRAIPVPKAPQEVLVRPDGAVAYVSCDASGQVAAISLKDWTVEKLIDAGQGADGLAWASSH